MKHDVDRMTAVPFQTAIYATSRRSALRSSALGVLGLLAGSALSQTDRQEPGERKPVVRPPESQERAEQSRAFMQRMRNASSTEECQQIMNEQMAWQHQRAFQDLKEQLRVPDTEWQVVKPRLQAVYDLVHPPRTMMGRNEQPRSEIEQRSRELREVLQGDNPPVEQIKAGLTALRAAKERAHQKLAQARQSLRQIMNLRQEAVLVLNGLLD